MQNPLRGHNLNAFFSHFCMYESGRVAGAFSNGGNEDLEQCQGLHVKRVPPSNRNRDTLQFRISLHKYWNRINGKGSKNFSRFTVNELCLALRHLNGELSTFRVDIMDAKIKAFEFGLNLQMKDAPAKYTRLIQSLNYQDRFYKIVPDPNFREGKQSSSYRNKDRRIFFVIYDKTEEVRAKERDKNKRAAVSENLIRVEVKRRRVRGLTISQLLTDKEIRRMKDTLTEVFFQNINFQRYYRSKELCGTELEVYANLIGLGINGAIDNYTEKRDTGQLSDRQLRTRKSMVRRLNKLKFKPKPFPSEREKEFKGLIISELINVDGF